MSLIRNIGGFLESNGLGIINSDIFIEEIPANPNNALLVVSSISPEPDQYLDTQTLNFEVWSRNESTKTSSDKLTQVFELLHRYHHLILGDYFIYFIGAIGNIENLDKDIERRSIHKLNFRAIYSDNRTVS